MAHSAAKKLHKANSKKLSTLRSVLFISNVVYALRFAILRDIPVFHRIVWPTLLVVYTLPYLFLRSAAQPTFDSYGNIVDAGTDLSNPGLLEYCHDLIYITVLVQIGVLFSRWMLLVYLIIPAFAFYKLYPGSSFLTGGNETEEEQYDEYAAMSRKERRKADRKAKRHR